ncbi:MAG: zinc ribbon domain-containing protein [Cyanobacteria bacterium P01_F01_bin.3]
MPACPRCDRNIPSTTIICPHCQLTLKAHGHPGMSLHRTKDNRILCDTCAYHADDSCNFPKRPSATSCTLYQALNAPANIYERPVYTVPWWRKINQAWLALGILIAISILVTIF